MPDFASALYLGLRHGSARLRPWSQLTAGAPAVLTEPPAARRIAGDLADLTGVEQALLATSTLHAFVDLFGAFGREPGLVAVDGGAYPIARWAADRAVARGAALRVFPHHDAHALERVLAHATSRRARPWVVVDGFCAGCGHPAPLAEYLHVCRRHGGRLLVDDTQALGILGEHPGREAPYGRGGGGSLRSSGLTGPEIVLVASLAKAFGAPLAALGGSAELVKRLASGDTRMHASPPSAAHLRAAERALEINAVSGEALRFRLAGLVARLRRGILALGLAVGPSLFPAQRITGLGPREAVEVHRRLASMGVRVVLHRPACAVALGLGLLITARHQPGDVDQALAALRRALSSAKRRLGGTL